jgi:hypothetical protein
VNSSSNMCTSATPRAQSIAIPNGRRYPHTMWLALGLATGLLCKLILQLV